jgi:6-phosphogluconolactonase
MWRLTLTLPVLNAARNILFLVSGEEKRGMVARARDPRDDAALLPASLVQPADGEVTWLLDAAASPLATSN